MKACTLPRSSRVRCEYVKSIVGSSGGRSGKHFSGSRGNRGPEESAMKDLAGRVAVITGAGSGFGREFARIGASERMKLVLADVQQDALDEAVAGARGSGAQARGVRADVSNAAEVQQLAAQTVEKFGAAHRLFNNAGVAAGRGLLGGGGLRGLPFVVCRQSS